MKKNIGSSDKVIRLLIAALILILAYTKVITGGWAVILLILAAILVLTSLVNLCPLYLLFGMNTNKKKG